MPHHCNNVSCHHFQAWHIGGQNTALDTFRATPTFEAGKYVAGRTEPHFPVPSTIGEVLVAPREVIIFGVEQSGPEIWGGTPVEACFLHPCLMDPGPIDRFC